jgi:hypothetical protein
MWILRPKQLTRNKDVKPEGLDASIHVQMLRPATVFKKRVPTRHKPSLFNTVMNTYSWRSPLQLRWVWAEDRGMTFFLAILIVVIFVIVPLAGLGLVERLLVDVGFSVLLISGAVATNRNIVLTWLIVMLTIAGLVVHWAGVFVLSLKHAVLDAILIMLLFGCFVVVMMLQIFRSGRITLHRVLGAVAAYLSIGIAWGYAYYAASLCNPNAVQFVKPSNFHDLPVARYIYFSFVTLTTVGYGDAIPMDPVARSLAIAEALTGQLYPAVLIAGVLGVALQSRSGSQSNKPLQLTDRTQQPSNRVANAKGRVTMDQTIGPTLEHNHVDLDDALRSTLRQQRGQWRACEPVIRHIQA